MQRQDQASGVPLEILEHLPPKPESAYFLLCALTYTSDFTGGCPLLPLSEKRVNLTAPVNKVPWSRACEPQPTSPCAAVLEARLL